MEQLTKKGFEVLFLIDPIDEVTMTNLASFKEKTLVDISKEDLDLGEDSDEEKAKIKEIEEEYAAFTAWMKTSLGDKVEKVIISKRLAETPCILVTSKFGWCVTAFHATSLARAYDVVPRSLEGVSRRFSSPTLCLLPFNVPTFHRD